MIDYGLYIVTDEKLSNGLTHSQISGLAIKGGANVIQLRDKSMVGRDLLDTAIKIRRMTEETDVMFIVNDRLDIALLSKADGLHVGRSARSRPICKRIAPEDLIVGASACTVEEAMNAERDGADYIGLGPIFTTTSKVDAEPACGLGTLRAVKEVVTIPVIAIGGIDLMNVSSVIKAGADGIAVISAVVSQKDVTGAARELKRQIIDSKAKKW